MKLAIMQPYIFPYIGYFQLINSVDRFIVLDNVNYINKGWINRNRIIVNGKEYMFTVPLKKISQNKLINELEISADFNWKLKILKTLENTYSHAPFYVDAFSIIKKIIMHEEIGLLKYILNSLLQIFDYLSINTKILDTSCCQSINKLKGTERIIEICKQNEADEYINPTGGMRLYDRHDFAKNKIMLKFLKTNTIEYDRMNQPFIPSLSIIDVMMFNSKTRISEFLNQYELI